MLQKLPVDLSTFADLREQNYLYVDKTQYAYNLITGGRRFFLSRPRRFGKTLFVSTLKEILLANRYLFEGLWIASSDYAWNKYAVITLDLSTLGIVDADSLKNGLNEALIRVADYYDLTLKRTHDKPELLLYDIVQALRKKYGHVALLIDEYDSPILHALKEPAKAAEIRDRISSFFAAIKGLDADISFLFITGVSNFAKAGLFSGLNNLRVISLSERFAGVCGYTESEITRYFDGYLGAWSEKAHVDYDTLRAQIKYWYNGYRFSEKNETVYNPFSLMNALDTEKFINFWFQSGTPTFLIEELKKEYRKADYKLLNLDTFEVSADSLGIFDVGATPLPALMYQTGYLTIVSYDDARQRYKLAFPNFEVKTTLQKHVLAALAHLDFASADQFSDQLKTALNNADLPEAVSIFKHLFAHVPYILHVQQEKFYHALLQIACDAAGIKTQSEYLMSHGRVDMILELPNVLYIVEIKFNKSAQEALEQIEDMKYYEPFLKVGKPIILLGLSFHREPKSFDITYKEKKLSL